MGFSPQSPKNTPIFFGFSGRDLRILFLFAALELVGAADSQIISPILPELAKDFGQKASATNQLVTVYFAGMALASLLAGPLLNWYGRKSILLLGAGAAALGNLAASATGSFALLLLYRFFDGLGSSLAVVALLTFIGDYFPYSDRGKAVSLITIGFFGGYTFGIPLGGLLAESAGWRWTLSAFGLFMGCVFLGCLLVVPRLLAQRSPVGALSLLRDFIDLHRRRQPVLAMIIYACIGGAMVGFMAYTGDWLYRRFGYDISARSQIFFWCGLSSLAFTPIAGLWADRSGKRIPSIIGSILICFVVPVVPFLPGNPFVIYPAFMLLAAAISMRQGPLLALVTEIVPTRRRGTFLAIRNAWTQVGAALGNLIVGVLYDHGGFEWVAIFSGLLTAITVVLLIGHVIEPTSKQQIPR